VLDEAVSIAVQAHKGHLDKQGKDYILHPLNVLAILVDHPLYRELGGMDRERACCIAILHDVVEDTDVGIDTIENRLGDREVVAGVLAITKSNNEPLEEYWSRVKAHPLARLVKLCDIKHNSSDERKLPSEAENQRLRKKYQRAYDFLKY
jgi:Guanosine polyphosphate pyrophosphohydrolases/synthetases